MCINIENNMWQCITIPSTLQAGEDSLSSWYDGRTFRRTMAYEAPVFSAFALSWWGTGWTLPGYGISSATIRGSLFFGQAGNIPIYDCLEIIRSGETRGSKADHDCCKYRWCNLGKVNKDENQNYGGLIVAILLIPERAIPVSRYMFVCLQVLLQNYDCMKFK